jgi:hypothetical protein
MLRIKNENIFTEKNPAVFLHNVEKLGRNYPYFPQNMWDASTLYL